MSYTPRKTQPRSAAHDGTSEQPSATSYLRTPRSGLSGALSRPKRTVKTSISTAYEAGSLATPLKLANKTFAQLAQAQSSTPRASSKKAQEIGSSLRDRMSSLSLRELAHDPLANRTPRCRPIRSAHSSSASSDTDPTAPTPSHSSEADVFGSVGTVSSSRVQLMTCEAGMDVLSAFAKANSTKGAQPSASIAITLPSLWLASLHHCPHPRCKAYFADSSDNDEKISHLEKVHPEVAYIITR